jgi:hypothetical protein
MTLTAERKVFPTILPLLFVFIAMVLAPNLAYTGATQ